MEPGQDSTKPDMLNSEAACKQYLDTESPSTIAYQIRRDQESCRNQMLPSLLAHFLPPPASEQADAIAKHLLPETAKYGRSVRSASYAGIVQSIKGYLDQMTPTPRHGDLPSIALKSKRPSNDDIQTTLDVLDYYAKSRYFKEIHYKTSFEDIVHLLRAESKTPSVMNTDELENSTKASTPIPRSSRRCYICQFFLVTHHPQYPSLCKPCGEFNLASCDLSLPSNLDLQGRTAFVTGGRLNLGYHTALRLLRCGAKVIITTRYPRDAQVRYMTEKDASNWGHSLKVIGADFRSAADVFHLIEVVKRCLKDWAGTEEPKLDILVNNAAQTLTDPLAKESSAVMKEQQLSLDTSNSCRSMLLCDTNYEPRIRGGIQSSKLLAFHSAKQNTTLIEAHEHNNDMQATYNNTTSSAPTQERVSLTNAETEKSSWMQSMHQVPYEDVISAHSVNTFVPLILIRELLPLMGSTSSASSTTIPRKPLAYVINVSSREGIFESSPNSSSKNGHHVHTNLTKAALNMLTETEAGPAWRKRRVAMNSVDPGYMSAAPEIEQRWKALGREGCPIGWEDGAGRVLWPIAHGEKGEAIWGRFLKHFGRIDVDVGVGR